MDHFAGLDDTQPEAQHQKSSSYPQAASRLSHPIADIEQGLKTLGINRFR